MMLFSHYVYSQCPEGSNNFGATSVKNYLVRRGIDNSRTTSSGYGENNPIESNETIEGRQKNRRVEFIIK